MKQEQFILTVFWIFGGAFVVFAYWLRRKHGREIPSRIRRIAQEHGFAGIRDRWWFGNGIRANWQGHPIDVYFRARYKGIPARIVTEIGVDGAPRLALKRKFGESWFQKPAALVGPPVVDFDAAEQLWVRADEAALAERVVRDPKIGALLDLNLVDRYDELSLGAKQLRVQRAIDENHLKARNPGKNQFALAEIAATDELPLAMAVVQALALRPPPR
ncbi:MAG TPA: hypothetical protein VN181_13730 [Thermoanaerobaculia bacterium]|nr:hypothetical protein [Thermoanaerobaculia bacterium]